MSDEQPKPDDYYSWSMGPGQQAVFTMPPVETLSAEEIGMMLEWVEVIMRRPRRHLQQKLSEIQAATTEAGEA